MPYIDNISVAGQTYELKDTTGTFIAPQEVSPAGAAHAAGDYLVYNGTLYQVSAAIAVGDALTAGTNITAVPDGIAGDVADLKSAIDEISETTGSSRNFFDDTELKAGTGITFADGVYTGTAANFANVGAMMSGKFAENQRYAFSAYAYTDAGSGTDGDGLVLRILYSDNTNYNAYFPNSTSSYTRKSVVSTEGKNVAGIRFAYASKGSNIWHVKNIQIEAGTETTDYVEPSAETITAVDTVARSMSTEIETISETVGAHTTIINELSESVTKAESDVSAISEMVESKNIFNDAVLKSATGITFSDGVFSGTASKFSSAGYIMSGVFEEGAQYTFSLYAKTNGASSTTGNGLTLRIVYSDGTQTNAYAPNNASSYARFFVTSTIGKNVSAIKLAYASAGSNVWDIKQIQVEKGASATSYASPDGEITAIDKIARAAVDTINEYRWYDRFGSDYLRIAYSAIWVDEINTATHWLFASDMGFNALKGDVQITSDGKLIMCHDAGFTFDENGRIVEYDSGNNTPIVNMTYSECKSKFYAHLPARYGGYCPVADIDDFIGICKDKGKICFVTVRNTNTADVVDALADKIIEYGMEKSTIINAIASSVLEVVRENPKCDDIAINFVAPFQTAITTANVDTCLSLGKCFLNIWNSSESTTVIDNSAAAIAYAKAKDVPLLGLTYTISMWNYLISKGIRGAQVYKPIFDVEPKSQRFKVTVSDGSASFGNLFAADRFTGTVSLSGTTLTVSDIHITDSPLTNVIDGIQPIKMNLLNPAIRAIDDGGNAIPCVWSNNAIVLTLNNANDNIYTVIVDV